MTHQEAMITVEAAPEHVWERVAVVEDWPDFLAGVRSVRRTSHERYLFTVVDGAHTVRDVPVAVGHHPKEHRIAWRALAGPRFDGEVRLAGSGPGRTAVTLTLTVEPAGFLAGVAELAGVTVPAAVLDLQRLDGMLTVAG